MAELKSQSRLHPLWLKIKPAEILFSRTMIGVTWFGFVLVLLVSPGGVNIPICLLRAQTGIPCFGCGLTRSVSSAFRGDFAASWSYHPFGILAAALILIVAVVSLLPSKTRTKVADFINRFPLLIFGTALATLVAFAGFGITRAVHHILTH